MASTLSLSAPQPLRLSALLLASTLLLLLLSPSALAVEVQEGAEGSEKMSQEELEAELDKIKDEVKKLEKEHLDIFHKGDVDKDGKMSPSEFNTIQKEDEPDVKQEELDQAFSDHDSDGSGFLDEQEWMLPFHDTVEKMMRSSEEGGEGEGMLSEEETIEHYRQEFQQYDKNQDGFIDLAEAEEMAKTIAKEQAEEGAEQEMYDLTGQQILDALDTNGDQKVDFEEYAMDGMGGGEDEEGMYGQDGMYGDAEGLPEEDEDLDGNDLSLDDLTSDHGLS